MRDRDDLDPTSLTDTQAVRDGLTELFAAVRRSHPHMDLRRFRKLVTATVAEGDAKGVPPSTIQKARPSVSREVD